MICSVPPAKSESSWLERLRSSKGLPVGNDLDLEQFLNHNCDHALSSDAYVSDVIPEKNSDSPNPNSDSASLDTKSVAERRKNVVNSGFTKHRKNEELFNVMSNVLADLFNMGDQGGIERIRRNADKKSSRKQTNPKIFSLSASASVDDDRLACVRKADGTPAMSPSSADNSVTEITQNGGLLKPAKKGKSASLTPAEEKSQTDLSSYSCVEVTIIDTSSSIWKYGKLIFRKGNVWKVREKKSSSGNSNACRRKRKASESDKKAGGKKKRKLSRPRLNTSNGAGQEELAYPSNGNARKEPCKETPDIGSRRIPKKRSQFSMSPRKPANSFLDGKPANSYSPVFHVQNISTSMKDGVVHLPPRSSLRDT